MAETANAGTSERIAYLHHAFSNFIGVLGFEEFAFCFECELLKLRQSLVVHIDRRYGENRVPAFVAVFFKDIVLC